MPPRRRLRSGSSQQDHDTTTVSALPNELLVRVMSAVARQPSFRGLCRVECVSRAWRDLAKARESELWQHVLTQRWSKQPALDALGVGPRRQVMLLAADGNQPRLTTKHLLDSFDFRIEIVVGDSSPLVATASLQGGWESLRLAADARDQGFEGSFGMRAVFPDAQLQAQPVLSLPSLPHAAFNWGSEHTLPQPLDATLKLRVMVRCRSDAKVAILLSTVQSLRQWNAHPRYWWSADGEDEEVACVGNFHHPVVITNVPWAISPTPVPLWGGSVRVEMEMYWSGPTGGWANESRRELNIEHIARVYCPRHPSEGPPQPQYLKLSDIATILKAPDGATGALLWV